MDSVNYNLIGTVFDIRRFSLHDDPGIRTVVFLEGYPLSCKWCGNPESQSIKPVIIYKIIDCLHYGRCMTIRRRGVTSPEYKNWVNRNPCSGYGEYANTCPTGTLVPRGEMMSIRQVIRELKEDATIHRCSGGGIALSGNESLVQHEFASELLQTCKGQEWCTVIETTGVGSGEAIEKVVPYADTVLLDLRHMDSGKHKKFTGIGNESVIKNTPEICKTPKTTVRVSMILGSNYSVEVIRAISEFTRTLVGIRIIHLLPYHPFGENKYGSLGQDYIMRQAKPLAPEDLEERRIVMGSYDFQCIISGWTRSQNKGRRTDRQLTEKIAKWVSGELGTKQEECRAEVIKEGCCGSSIELIESVGIAIGDTIGLVIASVGPPLVDVMRSGRYRSIGIVDGRVGAGPQVWAVDETVKATNTEIISVEPPRNIKGGAGHNSLIYIGADDAPDVRRAVEITLQVLPKYSGDVYGNNTGHLELQHTARVSHCLEKMLDALVGKASGVTCAGPAAIGTVLVDTAVKAVNVEMAEYHSPSGGTSYSSEVILTFTDDSGTVRQTVRASIEAGKKMSGALGDEPKSITTPCTQ